MSTPLSAEIRGVTIVDDSACVEVELTRDGTPTPWRAYTLDGPPRLVVEVEEQPWTAVEPDIRSLAIATAQMEPTDTGGARLIMPLTEPFAIDSVEETPEMIRVRLMPTTAEAFRADSDADWPKPEAKVAFEPPLVRLDPRAPEGSPAHTFAVDLRIALLATGVLDVAIAGEPQAGPPALVLALGADGDELDATVASPVAEAGSDDLVVILHDAGIPATQTLARASVPNLRLSSDITTLTGEARGALLSDIATAVVNWSMRTHTP